MTQLDIINKIKKELNVKFAELGIIKWNSNGYTVNQHGQVTGLGLYECEINDQKRLISFLNKLTQLQSLDLGFNQISDFSSLKDLTQLQSLNLGSNQISDISFLKDLTQLQSLNLGFNQISDISFLKDLTQLQSLDLRYNQISDISFLKDLTITLNRFT